MGGKSAPARWRGLLLSGLLCWAALFGFLTGRAEFMLLFVLAPFAMAWLLLTVLPQYADVAMVYIVAAPALVVLAFYLYRSWSARRIGFLAGLRAHALGFAIALGLAELVSFVAMHVESRQLGGEVIGRRLFVVSLADLGNEHRGGHARARIDGQVYHWSYREMSFMPTLH